MAAEYLFGLNTNSVFTELVNFNGNARTSALFKMEANPFPTILERHLLEMKCFFKCQEISSL